jgi:hypothetical protein
LAYAADAGMWTFASVLVSAELMIAHDWREAVLVR